jgi:hypothetical protein
MLDGFSSGGGGEYFFLGPCVKYDQSIRRVSMEKIYENVKNL